jgi:hypothetical protein
LATDDRYRVQSVERALELLATLAHAGAEGMTLFEEQRLCDPPDVARPRIRRRLG